MNKVISVSILGCGSRGATVYGCLMNSMPDKFKIVSLCDYDVNKLKTYKKEFNVKDSNCFIDEKEFFKEKRSDLLVIATLDTDHVYLAKKACKLGYQILLEKPISDNKEELIDLLKTAEKHNNFVMVCHVLRYTWANTTLMKLLKDESMGKLIQIDHTEQVSFWHFAHSYTRGNWRNTNVSAPMIMAKSCHDLDLLREYADSDCEWLTSYGDLTYLKKENAPIGSTDRCLDCKYKDSCPYSATYKYLTIWKKDGCPQCWPYNVLNNLEPLTEEIIINKLRNGPYGRCAFKCDNNVADNQCVMMHFANGVNATFRVTAFTQGTGRITIFYCSKGQIVYNESQGTIVEMPFVGENIVHIYEQKDEFGHGGGDYGLIKALYEALAEGNKDVNTSLEKSIESHLMAIAAEDSRLNSGTTVYLKNYK